MHRCGSRGGRDGAGRSVGVRATHRADHAKPVFLHGAGSLARQAHGNRSSERLRRAQRRGARRADAGQPRARGARQAAGKETGHSYGGSDMAVRIEKKGKVWTVIHSRREARNAMDPESADALVSAFQEFDKDPNAAVAGLWGGGGALFAGWGPKECALLLQG